MKLRCGYCGFTIEYKSSKPISLCICPYCGRSGLAILSPIDPIIEESNATNSSEDNTTKDPIDPDLQVW